MKARNGIFALLAALAVAGCGVEQAPTDPEGAPRLNAGGSGTSQGDPPPATAASDSTSTGRGITSIGSGN